jgi:hypothetical protein
MLFFQRQLQSLKWDPDWETRLLEQRSESQKAISELAEVTVGTITLRAHVLCHPRHTNPYSLPRCLSS